MLAAYLKKETMTVFMMIPPMLSMKFCGQAVAAAGWDVNDSIKGGGFKPAKGTSG